MHDDRRITEVRLERFVRERINPAVYTRMVPLELSSWEAPGEPVPALEAMRQEFRPQEHGAALEMMKTIKRALDPENLMNPGKMFEL